jgi:RAT1-interacting protein
MPSGHLTTIQSFKTLQLPRMVRGKPGAWDPAVCLDWAGRFLEWVKRFIEQDVDDEASCQDLSDGELSHGANDNKPQNASAPSTRARVYRIKFTPKGGASISLLDGADVADVQGGDESEGPHGVARIGFLPEWFWDKEMATVSTDGDRGKGRV